MKLPPSGDIDSIQLPGSVRLPSVPGKSGLDTFASTSPSCEGQLAESPLGWEMP